MDVFVARQPIFNGYGRVVAYELLYREDGEINEFNNMDGSAATKILISDAVSIVGLKNITNGKPAFINFTRNLIMNDFAYVCNPNDIVIEIVEDTFVDEVLLEKLKELRAAGYKIAVDDFVGDKILEKTFEHADIIKVDCLNMPYSKREEIARHVTKSGKILLAEKIESMEEFEHAIENNYTMFQGYYFSNPTTIKAKSVSISPNSFVQLIKELSRKDPDLGNLVDCVKKEIGLTYKLLQYMNNIDATMGNSVKSIEDAVNELGLEGIRRWVLLMMARDYGKKSDEESTKMAFIRGLFAEKVAQNSQHLSRSNEAFLMGMLSMTNVLENGEITGTIHNLPVDKDIIEALLEQKGELFYILDFVISYEKGDWSNIEKFKDKINLTNEETSKCYLDCVVYADSLFESFHTI